MRDKSHEDQVERWAEFVRDNPLCVWKPELKKIIIANRFYKRLGRTKKGKEKIMKLRRH